MSAGGARPGYGVQPAAARRPPNSSMLEAAPRIVSRSSAALGDSRQASADGSAEGLYGIGAGISVAQGRGFWVNSLKSGGPAEAAGLRTGDVLISIDGRRPSSLGALRSLLLGPKGTAVDIGLQRKMRPDAGSSSTAVQWRPLLARVVRGGLGAGHGPVLGIGMGFKVSAGGGFVVSNVKQGGPADRAGVLANDVICTYNGESLSNKAGSFLTESLSNNHDAIVRFGILREGSPALISVVIVRTPLSTSNAKSSDALTTYGGRVSPPSAGGTGAGIYSGGGAAAPVLHGGRAHSGASSASGYSSSSGYSSAASAYDSEKSDRYDSDASNQSRRSVSSVEADYSTDDDASSTASPVKEAAADTHAQLAWKPGPGKAAAPRMRAGEAGGQEEVEELRKMVAALSAQVAMQQEEIVALKARSPGHAVNGAGGHAEKEGGQGEVRSMLTAVKGVLAEMRAADVARQHDEAEQERKAGEDKRCRAAEALAAAVMQAAQAEEMRELAERGRVESDSVRSEQLAQVLSAVATMRMEHDGMLEGMDENKRGMEALCAKVAAQVKEHQHDTNKQLNQVRLELARHLQLPAIHASSSASVVQGEHAAPDDGAFEASTQQAAHIGALEHDDEALQLSPGVYTKSRHGARRSPLTSPAPAPGSETMPHDLVAPARSSPGAPAGLGARLQLKRCISDDAVPASLRCAAIVVGNRLFLFPKGRDGMCDLQFAMVMDVDSLRLWALRVMGSLPLRCRCAFVVVKDSICVFPCDASGRLDLRQTFVLTSADEDRVYSQGCYVEVATPEPCHCRCEVVEHLCFIFPHDGSHEYDMASACVLDTELMTLRVCGHELLAPPLGTRAAAAAGGGGDGGESAGGGEAEDVERVDESGYGHVKYHFEVCRSIMACFPHTPQLHCLLHQAWTADVPAQGMLLGAASAHDTSLEQTSGLSGMLAGVADSQSEGGVGAANGRVTRRQMIFDPAASQDPQLAGLHAACVAAQPAAEAGGDSLSASAGAEGGALVAEGIKDLRFIFKVVPSLSLILALAHDGRQALHLSDGSLFALYVPPAAPRALDVGAHDQDADAAPEPSQASPVLTKLMLRGGSLDRVQGRRCALHAVNHHIVLLPLNDADDSLDLRNMHVLQLSLSAQPHPVVEAEVHPLAVDVALDKDDVSVFVHGSKLLLLPNTRTNCCKLCAIDPGRGSVEVFALDNATRSGNGQELMKCGSNLIFIPFDSSGRRCVAEVSVLDCNVLSV